MPKGDVMRQRGSFLTGRIVVAVLIGLLVPGTVLGSIKTSAPVATVSANGPIPGTFYNPVADVFDPAIVTANGY
jgi:hypothetical protein